MLVTFCGIPTSFNYVFQQPSISLCPDCFKNGKFPAGTSAGEFTQVADSDPKPTVKEWTNKETLLLLEAVKRFGDNWNQVICPYYLTLVVHGILCIYIPKLGWCTG